MPKISNHLLNLRQYIIFLTTNLLVWFEPYQSRYLEENQTKHLTLVKKVPGGKMDILLPYILSTGRYTKSQEGYISPIMLSLPVIRCSSDCIPSKLHLHPSKVAGAVVPPFSSPVHNFTSQPFLHFPYCNQNCSNFSLAGRVRQDYHFQEPEISADLCAGDGQKSSQLSHW